jgi:multimeric flavodoxin WrbA
MNVVGFNGSPRTSGSAAWAISTILEAAKDRGAETMLFHSGELDIRPCKGCLGCVKSDR